MIVGDPNAFAILCETVDDWNADDTFCNGLLTLFVNGDVYPQEVVSATLRHEVPCLAQSLGSIAVDERLYAMAPQDAFAEIYEATFPENFDVDNDYRFEVSPPSLSDNGCHVFAVSDGVSARVLAARLGYAAECGARATQGIVVSEAFVPLGDMERIAAQAKAFLPERAGETDS